MANVNQAEYELINFWCRQCRNIIRASRIQDYYCDYMGRCEVIEHNRKPPSEWELDNSYVDIVYQKGEIKMLKDQEIRNMWKHHIKELHDINSSLKKIAAALSLSDCILYENDEPIYMVDEEEETVNDE